MQVVPQMERGDDGCDPEMEMGTKNLGQGLEAAIRAAPALKVTIKSTREVSFTNRV